jgi:hypothetical protein
MFLYVKDELLDEAKRFLTEGLREQADVMEVEEMIKAGYFGPQISAAFRSRVGNLVILPHAHQSTWWYIKDKFEQNYYGHHGGLTAEEMEIPLFMHEV